MARLASRRDHEIAVVNEAGETLAISCDWVLFSFMPALVRFAGSLSQLGFDVLGSPQLRSPRPPNTASLPTPHPDPSTLQSWFLLRALGHCQQGPQPPLNLQDNTMLWLPPLTSSNPHTRFAWHPPAPLALVLLRFDLPALRRLLEPSDPRQLQPHLGLDTANPDPQPVLHPMTMADREFALGFRHPPVPDTCVDLWCRGRVMEFLARRAFLPAGDNRLQAPRQAGSDLLGRVKPWLLRHLDQPLNLDQLARHLAISRSHLSRRFSSETGMTLRQYLQALRMKHAASLISERKLPVSTAALEVGYQSLGHFSAAFKRHHGCLPSEWHGHRS